MASMSRSIRRNIEKKNGVFVAQKPLRNRFIPSRQEFLARLFHKNKEAQTAMKGAN